jgi:hypothetical protein
MKWKYISSLKTRIYHQRFPNASAVTWSLVLQTRNLANKIENFSKCDDFSGEIIQLIDYWCNVLSQPPYFWTPMVYL